ncbi:UDP-N-acetylmuramate--L-alanine ligase [Mucilaginibacter gracilis]|uniref:UDP-N-acetylmuramate--L-alanine ligase n=1 Tax=Mucilaginibacter gracilis TaxID=423350 RepID=A0A495J8W8_9SPHI|nr:UDP-N-acetylmuramate--L-alanine ligase [Mucilaginibacter gracilis]RKR85456.1 UDP-N-acetylmuramate--L-alanine ligase [Mucilaginibacter gracilis]
MELRHINKVYLLGIGGIGMSGLARYFNHLGCLVCGYDKTSTPLTTALKDEGIHITFEDNVDNIPLDFYKPGKGTLIIYTPAVPHYLEIFNFFTERGFEPQKRSQVLGIISKGLVTVAVAGTHGKTTTSSMIAHILKASGKDCSAFLGGIASNYNSNVLFGKSKIMVVEADEYDRSFLTLHPNIAIITSMDADHLDIYGDHAQLTESFQLFASQLKVGGELIYHKGLPIHQGTTYGINTFADVVGDNISINNGVFYFNFQNQKVAIKDIEMGIAGIHNIENAVAAIQAALYLDVKPDAIKKALKSFRGVKRRFEYVVKTDKQIYIDDYAHHPEELRACISSIRRLYPNKKLTVVFQPHLFSRTRDFADGFAEVLDTCDELLMLDIYPARELPIAGVNSEMILSRMNRADKRKCGKEEVIEIVKNEKPELLLTVGAGDIDQLVAPLKNALKNV